MPTYPHAAHFVRCFVNTGSGIPIASTAYTVYQADGSTPATLYADETKGSTVSNPGRTSTAQGNVDFFCDPQTVVVAIGTQTQKTDVDPYPGDLAMTYTFQSKPGATTTYTVTQADDQLAWGFGSGSSSAITLTIDRNIKQNFTCDIYCEGTGSMSIISDGASVLHANITSNTTNTTYHHPGFAGCVTIFCRYNGTGTAADVFLIGAVT